MYQVLARKWRPKSWSTIAGQAPVVQALTHALDSERLHHAYLFTGTRGVGKTTMARLIAKSLNCEKGISSEPCQTCAACEGIDAGSYLDVIEVDGASRTRVEETRELLENVPFAPSIGRFKVYIIDEVHMLSTHSFNALLKTLEEPPAHVKFILATTEPEKLPPTILSRCLQFHLKPLNRNTLAAHLETILTAENIDFDKGALLAIAAAAKGSVRDSLSILDQAISFCGDALTADGVRELLGTLDPKQLHAILQALAEQNGDALFAAIDEMVSLGIDFRAAADSLLTMLHTIAKYQVVPGATVSDDCLLTPEQIETFSRAFSSTDLQLCYQMGLKGKEDLSLAPSPQVGFEMLCLRMLAFTPFGKVPAVPSPPKTAAATPKPKPKPKQAAPSAPPQPPPIESDNQAGYTNVPPSPPPIEAAPVDSAEVDWAELIEDIRLPGLTRVLAQHCALDNMTQNEIHLTLDSQQKALLSDSQKLKLRDAISGHLGRPLKITIKLSPEGATVDTPASRKRAAQQGRQNRATEALQQDATVQSLIDTFSGTLDVNAIEPHHKEET